MIKRIIACLTICLIITGLINPVFSDASALPQPNWSDPGISEIINISDLTGWMLNGGTFDVSTYTDAESFMNDYFNARTQTRLVSPGEAQEDYYEVLPGFGINNQLVPGDSFARPLDTNRVIASSFRDHTGYGRRFSNEVNNALLSSGHLYDTKIPLLNEIEFANFVNYNHDALRLYSEFFQNTEPTPTPEPGPDFSFVSNINKLVCTSGSENYYLQNNTTYPYDWNTTLTTLNIFDVSLINNNVRYGNVDNYFNHVEHSSGYYRNFFVLANDIIDINVIENENDVSVTYSSYEIVQPSQYITSNDQYWINQLNNPNYKTIQWWVWNSGNGSISPYGGTVSIPNRTSFNDLSTCINYIYQNFCNVNLYVNGEPWILADGDPVTPSITPEFPDAIGGEDLPNTTWPVHRPLAPYFITAPGMLQAIQDAIDDDGKLDIDDLKPYLTDENGDPVPDPIFDPEPVPIPVPDPVNPDIVPGLPVLPAMPPNMPGFSGVSVLAEIINFTNQSLPTSLIVTFWGIVFGIVILGLIKILHK